jgi:hypothetical protein
MNHEYKALPMKTILDPKGNPYISIIDDDKLVRIQLHSYDKIHPSFVNLDKRCLSELIQALHEIANNNDNVGEYYE